jgi:hypothetical protein
MMENNIKVGDRIKFLRDLFGAPTEDHPAFVYAYKDEEGDVTQIGGCWEGYWVKRDAWPNAFGCEPKDFIVISSRANEGLL